MPASLSSFGESATLDATWTRSSTAASIRRDAGSSKARSNASSLGEIPSDRPTHSTGDDTSRRRTAGADVRGVRVEAQAAKSPSRNRQEDGAHQPAAADSVGANGDADRTGRLRKDHAARAVGGGRNTTGRVDLARRARQRSNRFSHARLRSGRPDRSAGSAADHVAACVDEVHVGGGCPALSQSYRIMWPPVPTRPRRRGRGSVA